MTTSSFKKLVSGRILKVSNRLPFQSTEKVGTVLIGSSNGFLMRFLESPSLDRAHAKTIIAPRLLSLVGQVVASQIMDQLKRFQLRKMVLLQISYTIKNLRWSNLSL